MAHRYEDNCKKKSGQIPRFGEWEEANEMPITQYFENPRQAGLLHFTTTTTSSSTASTSSTSSSSAEALKFASRPRPRPRPRQTAGTREKKGPQRRVRDVSGNPTPRPPKPVDEDLYKIPPHLIHSSTRKRMPGFLACLVPCAS